MLLITVSFHQNNLQVAAYLFIPTHPVDDDDDDDDDDYSFRP